MKYFGLFYLASLLLLIAGSVLFFRRARNVSTGLLLAGSCLMILQPGLTLLCNISIFSDFFGPMIDRFSHYPFPAVGMVATGLFALGFFLHAFRAMHKT